MDATIRQWAEKGKALARQFVAGREAFSAMLIVAVGAASFGLGQLSMMSADVPVEASATSARGGGLVAVPPAEPAAAAAGSATAPTLSEPQKYVGSRNSNKYHLPWCSGAQRIAEQNKVWFSSTEEAEAAGYVPAGNCKGI